MKKMSAMCLLVILGLVACESMDETELEGSIDSRGIVGGTETNYEIWRSVVALKMTAANGSSLGTCSGTLIHPEVVLTAGHCVKMKKSLASAGYDMSVTPEQMEIKTGAVIGALGLKGESLSVAREVIFHEEWRGEIEQKSIQDWLSATPTKDFVDVALVRLEKPAENMGTYCVRSKSEPADGEAGVIVGYGLLGSSKQLSSGVQRWGDTTLKSVHSDVTNNYIEIGDPTNTCQGDSGGPVFTEVDGNWEVTGVTSHGASGICLPKQKSYSTNVVRQYDWIAQKVLAWTGDELGGCTLTGPKEEPVDDDTGGDDVDTDDVDTEDMDTEQDNLDTADDGELQDVVDVQGEKKSGVGCQVMGSGYAGSSTRGLIALLSAIL